MPDSADTPDIYEPKRHRMVELQLRSRGIRDERVLAAFERVPRHEFVLDEFRHRAYDNMALPIGHDQTISQPFMVATMVSLVAPRRDERVLEIGTGFGYQAAILRELAKDVTTIERVGALAREALRRLAAAGYDDITVLHADGCSGAPDRAPFDAIVVAAGAESIPPALLAQLADGGRLVIPVGDAVGMQLQHIRRRGDTFVTSENERCIFVPLCPGTL